MFESTRQTSEFPFGIYTALVVAAIDWLVYLVNMGTSVSQFWSVNLTGACLALVTVWLIERANEHTTARVAVIKAGCAALPVVVPLPVLGTLLGVAAVAWTLTHSVSQRRLR